MSNVRLGKVFYTCVAISSLARSAAPGTEYEIYILTGEEFPDKSLLNAVEEKYSNISLKIIRVNAEVFQNVVVNNSHVTRATFLRYCTWNE